MANLYTFLIIVLVSLATSMARIPNWRIYPANVDPNSCPDYPFCTSSIIPGLRSSGSSPLFDIIRYPDGHQAAQLCDGYPHCSSYYSPPSQRNYRVYPAEHSRKVCPNYPYCF